jgi:hypothetical protein
MKIYFDTEFTGLTENAQLISIGLVDENFNQFYAELPLNYDINDCSDFCKKEVLIHLGKNSDKEYSLNNFLIEFDAWLKERPNSILICDSIRDIKQINNIFPNKLPYNISIKKISKLENIKRRTLNFNNRVHKKFNLRTHHSLDDAIVNYYILNSKLEWL